MHVLSSLQEVQVKTDRVVFSVPQLVRFFHGVSQDTPPYLLGKRGWDVLFEGNMVVQIQKREQKLWNYCRVVSEKNPAFK